ncbi:Hypothetical protein PBC10988_35760 [Planctomycetales bacterium 10988]|nr:Hypothetical protein PBC10988_35760 [Planctomycetales bacterium 10988]
MFCQRSIFWLGFQIAVAFTLFFSAESLLFAQEMRIESKVFMKNGNDEVPISENLTFFVDGLVYDFLAQPEEVTILDAQPGRERFIVLDPARQIKCILGLREIHEFVEQVRLGAERSQDPFVQFLARPEFQTNWSPENHLLLLNSNWMQYRIQTSPVPNEQMRVRYHDFSNWYAKLNTMANPLSMPPFARLVVNQQLNKYGQIPQSVELKLLLEKQLTFRSEHKVIQLLSAEDKQRIQQTDQQFIQYRQVSFSDYYQHKKKGEEGAKQAQEAQPERR